MLINQILQKKQLKYVQIKFKVIRNNLGIILGLALAMDGMNKMTQSSTRSVKSFNDESEKNTYTEFVPNPENTAYKSKFLGSRSKKFKK